MGIARVANDLREDGIKDRWRWHVLLKGPSEALGRIVRYASTRLPRAGDVRVVIDRDPVSLL